MCEKARQGDHEKLPTCGMIATKESMEFLEKETWLFVSPNLPVYYIVRGFLTSFSRKLPGFVNINLCILVKNTHGNIKDKILIKYMCLHANI